MKKKGLVIFSGGQDSTSVLGYAMNNYEEVEAITFKYGQKHSIEIEQAKKICDKYKINQHIIDISFFGEIIESALTSNGNVNEKHSKNANLPASFVPNRNAMFITIAHALAQKIDATTILTGVCETDYSGYPDCRQEFIDEIGEALNLGSEAQIIIDAPLMWLDKRDIFQFAKENNILETVIKMSHTCYNGDHTTRHDWGYGCNDCPACKLRRDGYKLWERNPFNLPF